MTSPEYPDLAPLERTRLLDYAVDRAVALTVRPSDVLLVSGFWRSGTTWMMESLTRILGAKSVFEPLHPATTRSLYRELLSDRDDNFRENFHPFAGDHPFADELTDFLRAALWSRLPQKGIRQIRSGGREALRRRIVAKVVRGHLCLHRIRDTLGTPIIHVRRDVRAVVASVSMTKWAWQFDELSLRAQLLAVEDGRREVFEAWHDEIDRYDKATRPVRIAAYWALLERFVTESLATGDNARVRLVRYEDLVREPRANVEVILDALGFEPRSEDAFDALEKRSRTTSKSRKRELSTRERIFGWQDKLDPTERRAIEQAVEDLGMAEELIAS